MSTHKELEHSRRQFADREARLRAAREGAAEAETRAAAQRYMSNRNILNDPPERALRTLRKAAMREANTVPDEYRPYVAEHFGFGAAEFDELDTLAEEGRQLAEREREKREVREEFERTCRDVRAWLKAEEERELNERVRRIAREWLSRRA